MDHRCFIVPETKMILPNRLGNRCYKQERAILDLQKKYLNLGYVFDASWGDMDVIVPLLYPLCHLAKFIVNILLFAVAILDCILAILIPGESLFSSINNARHFLGAALLNVANLIMSVISIFSRAVATIAAATEEDDCITTEKENENENELYKKTTTFFPKEEIGSTRLANARTRAQEGFVEFFQRIH